LIRLPQEVLAHTHKHHILPGNHDRSLLGEHLQRKACTYASPSHWHGIIVCQLPCLLE